MRAVIRTQVYVLAIISLGIFYIPTNADAQVSQSLSVTPPLFQLSIEPGDIWQSNIKVVNGNDYPLTVYTEVVDFSATGEGGRGSFTPILETDPEGPSLAHWIQIPRGPHTIPPEQTKDISFFVEIPEDASPGGHYAAVLVTTDTTDDEKKLAVQTSQAVTSLFFIKIEGDIIESGLIRQFSATDSFVSKPNVELSLRFENKGNVHLQPRGDIVITNMWGTERGRIPVNYQTHFGNVLPNSIRDYRFEWSSDFKVTDIGRYTAEVALTYGEDAVKSEASKLHFWVIPVKATLTTLGILVLVITFITLMIKAYIRRMLTLAGVDPNHRTETIKEDVDTKSVKSTKVHSPTIITAPIKSGVLDLRKKLDGVNESIDVARTIFGFIVEYKKFFISVLFLIIIFVAGVLYISNATEEGRDYTVSVDEAEAVIPAEN